MSGYCHRRDLELVQLGVTSVKSATGRQVFADKVTIPARPFLGMGEDDMITIAGIALDELAEVFGGDAKAADVFGP